MEGVTKFKTQNAKTGAILKFFKKLILSFIQTKDHLSGHQSGYQIQVTWFSRQCGCSEQSNGIGQQAHHPGQAQAVEKNLTESKLVFLIGLTGLNP